MFGQPQKISMMPTISAPAIPAPTPMPTPAPSPAPAQQLAMGVTEQVPPQLQQGFIQPAASAYAPITYREPSFLSGPDVQQALKTDFMERLKQGAAERRAARGEEIATKIFGATIAPALAVFGGPGTSDAGVALIKEANQKVKEGRAEQQNRELAAFRGMQGIAEIVNTSSIKPLQSAFKAQNDFQKAAMLEQGKKDRLTQSEQGKADRQATRIEGQKDLETQRQKGRADLEDARFKNRQALLTQTLGEKARQFDLTREDSNRIADQKAEFDLLKEKIRLGLANAQEQRQAAQMAQTLKLGVANLQFQQAKFNSEFKRSLQRKDKNGFQFQDEAGQPLDPQQYMIEMNTDLFGSPDGSNLQALSDELEQYAQSMPQSQAQPQAKGKAAPQVKQSASPSFQQAIQKGANPEEMKMRVIQSLMNRGMSYADARAKVQGL